MDLSQWPDCKLWVDPRGVRSGAHGTLIPDRMGKQPDGVLKTPFDIEAAINANFYATEGAWDFTGNYVGGETEYIEWDAATPTLYPGNKSYAIMLDIHPQNSSGSAQVVAEIGSPLNSLEGISLYTELSGANLRLRHRENDGANVQTDTLNSMPFLQARRTKIILYRSKEQFFRYRGYWVNGTSMVDGTMEVTAQTAIGSIDELAGPPATGKTRIGTRYGVSGPTLLNAYFKGLFYGMQVWVFDEPLPKQGLEMARAMQEFMHAGVLTLPQSLKRAA